jgi:hypothetical protein
MCPIHLGWEVDTNGNPVPNTTRIQEGLTFVAEGPKAAVTFLACDRDFAFEDAPNQVFDPAENTVEVRIDDVAVVREDVYLSHQKATIPDSFGCYFSTDQPFPEITVGSVFDRTVPKAVSPFTAKLPFVEDFSDPAATETRWRFGGAELDETNGTLVLARQQFSLSDPVTCRSATFQVGVVAGETYVVDFKWDVLGFEQGDNVLVTTFDLNPGK